MTTAMHTQLKKAAIASKPCESLGVEAPNTTVFLAKLAELRESYLPELTTAREKVKKNFL
jgi:hypothetical protein